MLHVSLNVGLIELSSNESLGVKDSLLVVQQGRRVEMEADGRVSPHVSELTLISGRQDKVMRTYVSGVLRGLVLGGVSDESLLVGEGDP